MGLWCRCVYIYVLGVCTHVFVNECAGFLHFKREKKNFLHCLFSFTVYDNTYVNQLEYNPCTDFTDSSANGDCDTVTVGS